MEGDMADWRLDEMAGGLIEEMATAVVEPESVEQEVVVDWQQKEDDDDAQLIAQAIANADKVLEGYNPDAPIDQTGKDADAKDYEDISDDDLPDEEEATQNLGDVPGLTDDMGTSHDTDDLFGEGEGDAGREPSPLFGDEDEALPFPTTQINGHANGVEIQEPEVDLFELNFPSRGNLTNQDPLIPSIAETEEELVKQLYPSFDTGITLNWNELLPPKKAHFVPKVPNKPPRVLNPTKISLDLAIDQEKVFRAPGPAATVDINKKRVEAEARGLVPILEDTTADDSSDDGFDWTPLDPEEPIAGTTVGMIDIACADWEAAIKAVPRLAPVEEFDDEPMDDWEREILGDSGRKRKAVPETDYISAPNYAVPNFDDFEKLTAHVAKHVVIDLNDPHLLVETQDINPAAKRRRTGPSGFKRTGTGSLAAILQKRFNYSNDEVYDALKEAHASKVRATLSTLTIEHSLPALKLQWPYYKVKLTTQAARSFHRPGLKFARFLHQSIYFSKPGMRKRKEVKKMGGIQEIFKESKDLSLSETQSTATLFEYSEEHPNVLSNFGMGNRIINYYRRKDGDDNERPQPEDKIGDTTILLPEDRSPFANFGFVDPGETVRAIHNAMYRAPIFKHDPKNTDFLIIRNSTSVNGSNWYIRNIDNLFTVGQQFPSVDVPGPHSRKVTNAAKYRMKMIAFRKIKHSPNNTLKIGEITAHIADSTDMQNRQKLKEFVHYNKTLKVWTMKDGELIPDEPAIRSMVKPEEVCLVDAMQVGSRRLEDAGYGEQDFDEDKELDDNEEHNIEQDLAPWKTSKAFLEASADKAMLQLCGDGDPSGCGQAFSMIKISMKGGFISAVKGPAATSLQAMEELRKQNNGHQYNVKQQQEKYNDTIRVIWNKQKAALSNSEEPEDMEIDRDQLAEEQQRNVAPTPRSMATPAAFDDSASQFSVGSRTGKAMRIVRKMRDKGTGEIYEVTEVVKDPRVWREYQRRRHAMDADNIK
jgi:transcription initiation factor TFIID subunit 1